MDKSKIEIITQLVNSVDLSNINYSIIKSNCSHLYNIFKDLKKMWLDDEHEHLTLKMDSEKYKSAMKIVNNCLLVEYAYVQKELKKINQIIKLSDSNISFYYLDLGNYDSDIQLINKLFFESVCLAKYSGLYGKTNVIIIWIPIDKNRDYMQESINEQNLESSTVNLMHLLPVV